MSKGVIETRSNDDCAALPVRCLVGARAKRTILPSVVTPATPKAIVAHLAAVAASARRSRPTSVAQRLPEQPPIESAEAFLEIASMPKIEPPVRLTMPTRASPYAAGRTQRAGSRFGSTALGSDVDRYVVSRLALLGKAGAESSDRLGASSSTSRSSPSESFTRNERLPRSGPNMTTKCSPGSIEDVVNADG